MTEILDPKQSESARPGRPIVTVTYNGVDKELRYQPNATMQALLDQSLDAFAVNANRHLMALWTEVGVELPITGSVREAGVKQGDLLVLRPSVVRGG